MRTARIGLLAIGMALAIGCSSSSDEPGGVSGAAGANGLAGSPVSNGGTVSQPSAGTANGGTISTSAGTASGGLATGGGKTGGASGSGGGNAGASNGGAGAGAGGKANGGAAGSSGGSAGSGSCVPNLACKLSPPPSTGDIYQDCVDRINQFLTQCACLPALTRRKDGEACADQMAEYDAGKDMAHAGIRAKICEPGGSQNECPGYSSNNQVIGLCMQQMWDEGPPPTASCTGACYEEYGHFINMTDKGVTKVACGFFTTAAGKVWAVQNFSR